LVPATWDAIGRMTRAQGDPGKNRGPYLKNNPSEVLVAYSGGRDQEDCGSKPAPGK
jgi:hypothetical protein